MTTFVIACNHYEDSPLSVAANLDGLVEDVESTFGLLQNRSPLIVGPMDSEGSPPWMGINESGVFCGITNRMGGYPDKTLRTRGQLVLAALRHTSAMNAFRALRELVATDYNAFHLVVADRQGTYCIWSNGRLVTPVVLGDGIHVITERSFGAADTQREIYLRGAVHRTEDVADLADVLGQHMAAPFDSPCVHVPASGYATLCSAILEFHNERGLGVMFAPGPPCSTEFVDYSASMRVLLRHLDPPSS